MRVSFAEPKAVDQGLIIVAVAGDRTLGKRGSEIDKACGGALSRAMAAGSFEGKSGQALTVAAPAGLEKATIALLGVGDPKAMDSAARQAFGARICKTINQHRAGDAVFFYEEFAGTKDTPADRVADVAYGARLRSYRFDKYLTKEPADKTPTAKRLTVQVRYLKKR